MNRRADRTFEDDTAPAPQAHTAPARAPEEPSESLLARLVASVQWVTVPLFAAFVFGICGMVAAGSVEFTLREFAAESGVNRMIFVAVPGLFAMMWALIVYQKADQRITRLSQSFSRGILVALLTWISFSALAAWAWGPTQYWGFLSTVLLVSGIIGGGPMLLAALVAGGLVGWLIKRRQLHWIMTD
ncbi:MAG: hypothetical protein NZL99_03970 [Burkholderiaceae bacterium]|nr:hypothetical protein [Burkholderiaceae bacterium]MCX8004352.1 hypothetical protein [Burkholderiaceae bacterium]